MRHILENIFVTALEGGSNYWYLLPSKEVENIREFVPKSEEPSLSMAMFMAIFDRGLEVDIHDVENPEECLGSISLDSIMRTIKEFSDDKDFSRFFSAELREDGDGESSDALFQYFVMGEIVFG